MNDWISGVGRVAFEAKQFDDEDTPPPPERGNLLTQLFEKAKRVIGLNCF